MHALILKHYNLHHVNQFYLNRACMHAGSVQLVTAVHFLVPYMQQHCCMQFVTNYAGCQSNFAIFLGNIQIRIPREIVSRRDL